MKHQYHKTN